MRSRKPWVIEVKRSRRKAGEAGRESGDAERGERERGRTHSFPFVLASFSSPTPCPFTPATQAKILTTHNAPRKIHLFLYIQELVL